MSDLEYENAFLKRHGYLPEQAIERIAELEALAKQLLDLAWRDHKSSEEQTFLEKADKLLGYEGDL